MPRASSVTIEDIQAVFFRAVQAGYAQEGAQKTTIENRPGSKSIEYREEDYLVVDEYYVTKSDRSEGVTRIWFRNILVWSMHYWGEYPKHVIPLLKAALRETYIAEEFIGGRGRMPFFRQGMLEYRNYPRQLSFDQFRGMEEIIDLGRDQQRVGYHHYAGMLMVDLPLPDGPAEQIIDAVQAELEKVDFSVVFAGQEIFIEQIKLPEAFSFEDLHIYPPDTKHSGYFYFLCSCGEVDGYISVVDTSEKMATAFKEEIIREFIRVFRKDAEFAELWEL